MSSSPVQVCCWTDSDFESFDREKFFRESGIELDPEVAQFSFSGTDISSASRETLSRVIGPGDLVIGYELSPQTRALIEAVGADFIDIWLHPVRFMDDILFALRASRAGMQTLIEDWAVPRSKMEMYADRLRVQAFKGWERKELPIKENSAAFIGQMNNDKSVFRDGRFLDALDFRQEIETLARDHDEVLYLRHPYLKQGDEAVLAYLDTIPNVTVSDLPTYKVIAHPNVRTVMSISSSVLEEAKLFGKSTRCLFQPVIPLFDGPAETHYASIMHAFLSPRFWTEILLAEYGDRHTPLGAVPHTEFDSPKDKMRDMLGFYWSYAQIDKLEQLRKFGATASKPQVQKITSRPDTSQTVSEAVSKSLPTAPAKSAQSEIKLNTIKDQIQTADIISFDIFDTILESEVGEPSDLFTLIAPDIKERIAAAGHDPVDFVALRKSSRHLARHLANGEEVCLAERYEAMAGHQGWPGVLKDELLQVERDAEAAVLRPRWAGRELYDFARAIGKRVIFTSDTYFSAETIDRFLSNAGYQPDAIYLSSDHGRLKATGNLFKVVLDAENTPAGSILHIGDNDKADIEKGRAAGLSVAHLPSKTAVHRDAPYYREAHARISDACVRSAVEGMTSTMLTAQPYTPGKGMTNGHLNVLGYSILGPVFLGFANWILKAARDAGIKDIYFLARDGDIPMRCCEHLRMGSDPELHYIPASRRSTRMAGLHTEADVADVLKTPFDNCTLRELLSSRFGVKVFTPEIVQEIEDSELGHLDRVVSYTQDRDLVAKLLFDGHHVRNRILEEASRERQDLTRVYEDFGLHSERDGAEIAFVDIGHGGTIQRGITDILGLENTLGLYFSTYDNVEKTLRKGGHVALSYFGDRLATRNSIHPYKRYLSMFEAIFLNSDDSFLYYDGARKVTEAGNTAGEVRRKTLAEELHHWIEEFTRTWTSIFGLPDFDLPGHEAVQPFLAFLKSPSREDARIFEGIPFDDSYNARGPLWLIPPQGQTVEEARTIWKEGARALADKPLTEKSASKKKQAAKLATPEWRRGAKAILRRLIAANIALFSDERRESKFRRKPYVFFRDSRNPFVRALGAAVYGGKGK
ncbi:hypothetical protein Salmuc_03305 [Salipiger mucosus DSM 16094]|uniref:Hydrolase (HAD superfamily) n=1 Tax=Salipiger mucosus DSM 16094 TaxID=1123237 RepID=S9QEI4_9RHOB|nr:hypothetical protein Salmuc_03305 [Salipiger mucosus DSM 16094]